MRMCIFPCAPVRVRAPPDGSAAPEAAAVRERAPQAGAASCVAQLAAIFTAGCVRGTASSIVPVHVRIRVNLYRMPRVGQSGSWGSKDSVHVEEVA